MTKTWEKRQQAFSDLSDFAQENFSGIAVIKAFVKELKELIAFRKLNKENEKINVEYTLSLIHISGNEAKMACPERSEQQHSYFPEVHSNRAGAAQQ